MKKQPFLFVSLLSVLATTANAADITINVPVEITRAPAKGVTSVYCQIGIGAPGNEQFRGWRPPNNLAEKSTQIPIVGGGYKGVISVAFLQNDRHIQYNRVDLNKATHYKCWLWTSEGDHILPGANTVVGTIPR